MSVPDFVATTRRKGLVEISQSRYRTDVPGTLKAGPALDPGPFLVPTRHAAVAPASRVR